MYFLERFDMSQKILTEQERFFFNQVKKIIYSNPFAISQKEIADRFPDIPSQPEETATDEYEHHFGLISQPLTHHLERLKKQGVTQLKHLQAQDRELVRHSFLFDIYHQSVKEWDQHIQEQLQKTDAPIPVLFAEKLLAQLRARGFSQQESLRYFGFFFQVRRAYFFIDRALVGQCPSIEALRRELWNSLFTENALRYERHLWDHMEDFSTLLLGETGTGKGAAAAAIGRSAFIPFDPIKNCFKENFTQSFVATNLSQFSENLIESEIFGHRKGSFTGAINHHKGLLERCSQHGALFLDEIGDVTPTVQIKLLKVLQERQFSSVGSHTEQRFSGRIIAATNRNLTELMQDANFRDDFYYRLSSHVINMPSLRHRISESPVELDLMVSLILERTMGRQNAQLSQEVLSIIHSNIPINYHWPGNVRELEQVVRRVLLTQKASIVKDLTEPPKVSLESLLLAEQPNAQELLTRYCQIMYEQEGTYEAVARKTGLDRRTVKKYMT